MRRSDTGYLAVVVVVEEGVGAGREHVAGSKWEVAGGR